MFLFDSLITMLVETHRRMFTVKRKISVTKCSLFNTVIIKYYRSQTHLRMVYMETKTETKEEYVQDEGLGNTYLGMSLPNSSLQYSGSLQKRRKETYKR